jgi:hypothetical protein
VLVECANTLSLRTYDLTSALWSVDGVENATFVCDGDTVFYGPARTMAGTQRYLLRLELSSGRLIGKVEVPLAEIVGTADDTLLLRLAERDDFSLRALDRRSLAELWRQPSHPGLRVAPSWQGRFVIADRYGVSIRCLEAATGECVWRCDLPSRSGVRGALSLALAGNRAIVITPDRQVFAVSLETGRLLGRGESPTAAAFAVTERRIFFKQPFALSEFDHEEMREVGRIEYRAEVEPLYRGLVPTVNALWLTEQTVIWTTAHGALMGVSRTVDSRSRRTVWVEEIPGALMPLGRAPVGYGDYLYYAALSGDLNGPFGLYCYEPVSGPA